MKIVVRVKGGLGNQLFCYAAARQLAVTHGAELVIDNISGFSRDFEYRRRYELSGFSIESRMATPKERLEPFSRLRRRVSKYLSENCSGLEGLYLVENDLEPDDRILTFNPRDGCFIDGLWQNEKYFKGICDTIRRDLTFVAPTDSLNVDMQSAMLESNSVGVHVRWFEALGNSVVNNISVDYYNRAIDVIEKKVENPRFFLFSDDPRAAAEKLGLTNRNIVVVDHNSGELAAHSDLWLMSNCKHMITANSTFSWWGAWLIYGDEKFVVYPKPMQVNSVAAQVPWHLTGSQPIGWMGV
jgi:hypothetical protein